MTHDELLNKIKNNSELEDCWMALQKVVELHKPEMIDSLQRIYHCSCWRLNDSIPMAYPCPTIQAIEKELQ